jgi:hypothetical protein
VTFAAFDIREAPLRPGSIRAVSDCVGIGNIPDETAAIEEVRRVLGTGSDIFAYEHVVEPKSFSAMPEEFQRDCRARKPWWSGGAELFLKNHGFSIIRLETRPGRKLVPEEDGIARVAAEHGVTLTVNFEYVQARKAPCH